MKNTLTLKLGVALAGVLLCGAAFAQAPDAAAGPGTGPQAGSGFGEHRPPFERAMGSMGDHGRWWNNPKAIDRLKLTDAQRKAMDDTMQQHREGLVDLHGTLEKAELELEPMMKEDQPNESQILAQIDKVAQARAELEKANARFLLAIRSKLTPDQWKQMQADRASHPRAEWGKGAEPGVNGQPRGNWQRRNQGPPPPDGQSPPPAGPQSMLDEGPIGSRPDGSPQPQPSMGGLE